MQTIIQRLRRLGYAVHSVVPSEGEGLLVRSIGRAKCASCDKPHLYMLDEIVSEERRAIDRKTGEIFMEWLERRTNPLGSFCNTCGAFSEEEVSEPEGHFGIRLIGITDIGAVIATMETHAGELAPLSTEQLQAKAKRLEIRLEALRRAIAVRKGYRDL